MGQPAAREGDLIVGLDIHIVMVPSPTGPVPTPLPHPFMGQLNGALSEDVTIGGKKAAVVGSTADNSPKHIPTPPGTAFQKTPADKATVKVGSQTVTINGKAAARLGDVADTCNDPADAPMGSVIAVINVLIG